MAEPAGLGPAQPYAEFFDIQWHSSDPLLAGQLLLPFLGTDYGVALHNGEIPLTFDSDQGVLQVAHYEHRFPICPLDYGQIRARANTPLCKHWLNTSVPCARPPIR